MRPDDQVFDFFAGSRNDAGAEHPDAGYLEATQVSVGSIPPPPRRRAGYGPGSGWYQDRGLNDESEQETAQPAPPSPEEHPSQGAHSAGNKNGDRESADPSHDS